MRIEIDHINNRIKNHTMKHLLLFAAIFLLATGCSRDDDLDIQFTDGNRLVRHVEFYNSSERITTEYFFDELNTPVKAIETINIIFLDTNIDYIYDERNRLVKVIKTSSNPAGPVIHKSEHFYDDIDRLERIRHLSSLDDGETYLEQPIAKIRYYYNDASQLYRKERLYRDTIPDASWNFKIENFYYQWEDNNIAVVEEYNRMGELAFTREFEYDNKVNYLLMHPEIFVRPETLTQNNVVREEITDHLNHLPNSACTVCRTTYRYNTSGKPVMYRSQKEPDKYFVLTYE
ncbi:MAG: hypothetical protein EA411_06970 [Saprospirales bacterium]|nr:MAG: hypothetical protein EA411_06970 [Saprospirales bacterium]